MFISSASVDDNDTFVEREYEGDDLSGDLVADLVRSLDGIRHTLVSLSPGGEAHMAIGGDASEGLVVYVTSDNTIFYNLRTSVNRHQEIVTLVAWQVDNPGTMTAETSSPWKRDWLLQSDTRKRENGRKA